MKKKNDENVAVPTGKGWLRPIKKGLKVLGTVAGVLLATPLKLPGRVLQMAQYLALLIGIVEATDKNDDERNE